MSKKTSVFLILLLAALLLFWKISSRGLNEWDESRNGVNAFEMLRNHDYINLYYRGALDLWNAKPPLLIWLIGFSYKLFGENPLALRLPSALSTLGFFAVFFFLLYKGKNKELAVLTCGILLGCGAVIGIHVGLTGDFDALLLLLLAASAYFFWIYCYEDNRNAIYLAAVCTGLAWYVKGPAAFLLLPGFFLAGCVRKRGFEWLRDFRLWLSLMIVLLFVISWIVVIHFFGRSGTDQTQSVNSIQSMFAYDIWKRFTTSNFEGAGSRDYFFFFSAIDVRMNIWNYVLYLTLLIGLYQAWKSFPRFVDRFRTSENGMVHFMTCLILFPVLFLTFAASKHDWYLAPVLFAMAYVAAKGVHYLSVRFKALKLLFAALFLFTFARNWLQIDQQATVATFLQPESFAGRDTIITAGNLRQDMYLQLVWSGIPIRCKPVAQILPSRNVLIVIDTNLRNEIPVNSISLNNIVSGYFVSAP